MDFSFPKNERIKSKKLMEAIFTEGKNLNNFPLKLIYLPSDFDDDTQFKVAVVAPKRNFKKAVDRNRIKRLMREAYRLNKGVIFNNSERDFALVFLYLGKEMPDFQLMESKMTGLLEKFLKKIANEEAV
ncbi:ribonuclease P protein component [Croceivirga thetidis]|uniref:Ribonuclease P protein component n=1 Tax=Croceivirga thetidis TaxID=2721623 RepID=A0ABX1GMW1_9FLAO|nr:ribonuclease P protein component [Croceivirga thetidis]NKI31243.1 ribonuclease P protein component [Croceivirga thetidis]